MSHYSLAVFTAEKPCEMLLHDILAPFEESPHNTRSKWDWWMIGGRWYGELILKPGASNFITGDPAFKVESFDRLHADGARIKDIDFDTMLIKDQDRKARQWDRAHEYRQAEGKPHPFLGDTGRVSREEHIQSASAFQTFAYLHDGEWHERGEMGWFAIVTDEMDEQDWNIKYETFLHGLPDTTWVTIIDCHI